MMMARVVPGPVSEWLHQAEHDLAVARALLAQGFFDWAAFAAQQSGEKSVKAVRLALGTPIETIKVHGVDELLADMGRLHPRPDPALARASELNAHNAGARYPGVRGSTAPASSYPRPHAEDAIKSQRRCSRSAIPCAPRSTSSGTACRERGASWARVRSARAAGCRACAWRWRHRLRPAAGSAPRRSRRRAARRACPRPAW